MTIYNRQISTESGWDNPFRPDGDLSKEADEIVNAIKCGKAITPTSDFSKTIVLLEGGAVVIDGGAQKNGGNTTVDGHEIVKKVNQQQQQQQPKSPKVGGAGNGDTKTATSVNKTVIPGPTSANHVVIEDKKKKKCNCCVIQ